MKDFSWNLPYWARLLGYKLEGEGGTFGSLRLFKGDRDMRYWVYSETPNLIEMEDYLKERERI